jgi:regulator of sirC expression with transglutaminase-like and TPR domain
LGCIGLGARMKWFCLFFFGLIVNAAQAAEDRTLFSDPALEASLESLFTPNRDLAGIKFTVDQMADPAADTGVASAELDRLTATLLEMAAGVQTSAERLAVLKRLIYETGAWNDKRPFVYDMDDPLGKKPENRYLHNYLTSRRGNCITMPILFAALGQRIGLDLTLAEAPQHLLVKYTDDSGTVWNLEPTSGGGFARDSHYREELPMTDKAVEAGTYLRALSAEETAAITASHLPGQFLHEGRYEQAVITVSALLRHYPRSAYLMTLKGAAYGQILRRDVIAKYKRESDMTPEVKEYADKLYAENLAAFASAEALGWTERDGMK